MTGSRRASAVALVLGATVSVQTGAAIATSLFDRVGPAGTVLLRVLLGAVILVAVWRPVIANARGKWGLVVLFGLAMAAMNLTFYTALDRIPLGIAVTLEFVGPLGVAIAASRRRFDLIWVALAACGIVLLSPLPGSSLDTLGAGLALLAGGFWALYIVTAARIGQAFESGDGLALAMVVASALLLPLGVAKGGVELVAPAVLGVALAVALLSTVIPYSFELEALRRLPQGTFGVLMSLEPAVATVAGLVILGQRLSATELVAIALVIAASAGALSSARAPAPVEA